MKRLLLFLTPLALASCAKECPEPPKTPPGYVCGQAKNFASAHQGEHYTVPNGMGFSAMRNSRPTCEVWPTSTLEVIGVEGRMVRVRYVRPDTNRFNSECEDGETVYATIFDIANTNVAYEEREDGLTKLETQ